MGDWALNPTCWPDPQGMVDELRELGIELMITVWPFMGASVRHARLGAVGLLADPPIARSGMMPRPQAGAGQQQRAG